MRADTIEGRGARRHWTRATEASAITAIAAAIVTGALYTLFALAWSGWAGSLACISLYLAQGCTP